MIINSNTNQIESKSVKGTIFAKPLTAAFQTAPQLSSSLNNLSLIDLKIQFKAKFRSLLTRCANLTNVLCSKLSRKVSFYISSSFCAKSHVLTGGENDFSQSGKGKLKHVPTLRARV